MFTAASGKDQSRKREKQKTVNKYLFIYFSFSFFYVLLAQTVEWTNEMNRYTATQTALISGGSIVVDIVPRLHIGILQMIVEWPETQQHNQSIESVTLACVYSSFIAVLPVLLAEIGRRKEKRIF